MIGPMLNLLFIACFWIAANVAVQLFRDNRADILAALFGRGGLKRLPRVGA